MAADQIIQEIKNKVYYPIYLLMGEEAYYIDSISACIENTILNEMEKEFNQLIAYGKDTDAQHIIDTAKKYPMMANYQVIVVKEAQSLNNIEALTAYAENPLKSTILVLCYKHKKYDLRKPLAKAIKKNGLIFHSEKIRDYKVAEWIANYVKSKKLSITPKATQLLADSLGTDLSKIVNEIDKLLINLKDSTEISCELIEKHIGISKDYNVFELQNALGKKDVLKANKIIDYFSKNPKDNPMVFCLSILYGYFMKILIYTQLPDKSPKTAASKLGINPFFVKDFEMASKKYSVTKLVQIISFLREYDLKSKGVGSNLSANEHGSLYKELIFKILH